MQCGTNNGNNKTYCLVSAAQRSTEGICTNLLPPIDSLSRCVLCFRWRNIVRFFLLLRDKVGMGSVLGPV